MGRLAVAQMTSTTDPEYNYSQVVELVHQAKGANADLLCLPECFAFISSRRSLTLSHAEPLSGPLVARYRRLAASSNLWLSLGGFHEAHPTDAHKIYNTHLLVDAGGAVAAVYRKTHLFDAALPGGSSAESALVCPGGALALSRGTPVGAVGLSVCYDLRFPALYETLRHSGAEVVLVPSAFFRETGRAHWETLLRARAIENQVYVAAAAQVGVHGDGRKSWGHAMVVDPWGDVVADMGGERCGIVTVEVDGERLKEIRSRMDIVGQRRNDLYGELLAVKE